MRALVFLIAYPGIYFVVSAGAGVAWALQHPGSPTEVLLNDPMLNIVILVSSSILSIGMVCLFRRLIDRKSIFSMGFSWKGQGRYAGVGIVLALVLLGAGSLILYWTEHIDWLDTRLDGGALLTGLVLFMLTALSEEMVFRGYILNNLLTSFNKWAALGVASLLFTLVHLGNAALNPVALLNLLAGGVLLGINYIYTRNLWFSICFHFTWNFFQGAVLGYAVSGLGIESIWQMDRKGDGLLTGGAFGFEGSMVATGLLVLAVLLCWWWQQGNEKISK
ncbi:CPBP family intramembrane glutamic endopeptidase [Paraflavitalea speifideaquila]|uniref:CPBP family intramembrane glutamic endopeptidase n=1 Tax=Paraflavitalea speifideaquila TaxID=3076558 RepID=UPI0028EDF2B6|nr:CPBP family intramembrane glutamic endopeptidase [Paraflavitalea speifideiaquila]